MVMGAIHPQSPASRSGPCKGEDKVRTLATEVKKGDDDQVKEEAASPSMKLCIGIGDDDRGPSIRHGKALLTEAQLVELQRQVIIYKYIATGLPVPSTLVLPFWKSVDSSSGSVNVEGYSPQEFDYRNMMDPEPGRCRRTDGKKWRCKKNVVSGHKYCEQHMHRGRKRSRKPVEASQMHTANATSLKNPSKTSQNPSTSNSISIAATLSNNTGISHKNYGTACSSANAQIIGCTTEAATVVSGQKAISTSWNPRGISGCLNANAIMITSSVPTDSTITTATTGGNKGGSKYNHETNSFADRNVNCSDSIGLKNLIYEGNSSRNFKNAKGVTSQGLNFSPKSVLQDVEPGRCRRTDGKKWRCRRDVVPGEKYCKIHMHRGAKKPMEASQSPALLNATPETSTTTATLLKKADGINLNTTLSISLSANHQLGTNDTTSDTTISNNSDTIISNTIIAPCENGDSSS
ncbi:hypothetical protein MANES_01G264700v8 [Manihot esculenta]|uniref:Growth-regulating factor n=1 Tax=Manihot esculenta TaxID=3983 RepID=A0A2C9WPD6_MANES|nr:hypothetical protein MANES_01G264700v8 [Manihot esculenta]